VLAAVGGQPASAVTQAVGAIEGSGTISPGLTTTPVNQALTFSGLFAGEFSVDTAAAAGIADCTFTGGGNETIASGFGTLQGLCSTDEPLVGTVSIQMCWLYSRVGSVFIVTDSPAACGFGGQAQTGVGEFVWFPTSSPIVSYRIEGSFELEGL
jgi:hypothetical protein